MMGSRGLWLNPSVSQTVFSRSNNTVWDAGFDEGQKQKGEDSLSSTVFPSSFVLRLSSSVPRSKP